MKNAGKLLEDNEYFYGIILKGRWYNVMDDTAYRAHLGMTIKWSTLQGSIHGWHGRWGHNKNPLTDKAAISSELHISYMRLTNVPYYVICVVYTSIVKVDIIC